MPTHAPASRIHTPPAAHRPACTTRRAFTLVELLITLALAAVLVAVLLPGLAKSRNADRTAVSQHNLRTLGQASVGFAFDNDFAIFGLDTTGVIASNDEAVQILSRLTGRPIESGSEDQLLPVTSIAMVRRYQHVALMDYLDAVLPEPMLASPFDRKQLNWQADPVFAQANTVPYIRPTTCGCDSSPSWQNSDVKQLWPYASSYQVVPAAWNPNNHESVTGWAPVDATPHLFYVGQAQRRFYSQVAFPSGKVLMFEEFDGLWLRDRLWFAYPEAACNLLFFDGSVRRLRSDESNPGWNPSQPNEVWKQRYSPFDEFPWYAEGYRNLDVFPMRYRWTREGLAGIDYGGRDVNVPPEVRADPAYREETYPDYNRTSRDRKRALGGRLLEQ